MKRLPLILCLACIATTPTAKAIGFANGTKIGEVDDSSVVLWTRLTQNDKAENRVPEWSAEKPNWTCNGHEGDVRFIIKNDGNDKITQETPWAHVTAESNFCHQQKIKGLTPDSTYDFRVEGRSSADNPESCLLEGSFKTAPRASDENLLHFTISTCQEFELRDDVDNGHRIYQSMLKLNPAFFIQTGDAVYYDRKPPLATNIDLARYRWNRMYALPFQKEFHRQIPSYWMHDDHDLLKDDCWPGQSFGDLTWDQGVKVWSEQVPQSDKSYRTFRWGKHLQIWMPEGRYYRSPDNMPDGPEKTILGKEQWQWLEQSLAASNATFKLYISATPVVGPDRKNKNDNHANDGFHHEGQRLRELLSHTPGCFVINGDRHWQYHSIDTSTGLNEFGCGPSSDAHAGGFNENQRQENQKFLRIKGGFLSAEIQAKKATLILHDVDGKPCYEFTQPAP